MATDLMNAPPVETPPFQPWRFTLEEYRQIRDSGILDDGPRFEFLDGWIVPKMTQGTQHAVIVHLIQKWLSGAVPDVWEVRVQSAVESAENEPEPDVTVVLGPATRYLDHHPTGSEIGLLIEVADSSLVKDRRKARIYADGGVPNYWLVNLIDRQVEVFRNPLPEGLGYRDQHIAFKDETLEAALDENTLITMPVCEVLGQLDSK
jgi:Uma2 family endonuclease